MKIIAVMKDTGGTNAMLPVVLALRNLGHTVSVVVPSNASGLFLLRRAGVGSHIIDTPQEVIDSFGLPEVFITSVCSYGGVGRDLVPALRGKAPTIALTNQWHASINGSWKASKFRPDFVVVNDTVGRDLVLKAWEGYDSTRIKILGYATLDALHGFDAHTASMRVRKKLGLSDELILYFSGQLIATAAAAQEIAFAVRELRDEYPTLTVLVGLHPRLDLSDPLYEGESIGIKGAMNIIADRVKYLPVGEERIPELDLVAASNVTVGMYTTALMHAAAMRKPAISLLYPGSPMHAHYRKENGGLLDTYALVELGCVAGPLNQLELIDNLRDAFNGRLQSKMSDEQALRLRTDGQNAARIAAFISSI